MEEESGDCSEKVDDIYFYVLSDDDEDDIFPVSDEKYALGLHLQEALFSSASTSVDVDFISSSTTTSINRRQQFTTPTTTLTRRIVNCIPDDYADSAAESSAFICSICMENKPKSDTFRNVSCSHRFCLDCIRRYVSARMEENVETVRCPESGCKVLLDPEWCRDFLPVQVFDRWSQMLSESSILSSNRFYCPFPDCSALLISDSGVVVTQAECPHCFRLFCASCRVTWHDGIGCEDYMRLPEAERSRDDILLKSLAKTKQWQRCTRCKFYVEKRDGCSHMKCWCNYEFCYSCGGAWTQSHVCRT